MPLICERKIKTKKEIPSNQRKIEFLPSKLSKVSETSTYLPSFLKENVEQEDKLLVSTKSQGDIVDETVKKETDCLQLSKSSIQDIYKYDIGLFFDKIHLMSDNEKFDHITNVWKPSAYFNFRETKKRGNVPINGLIFFQPCATQSILFCFVCVVVFGRSAYHNSTFHATFNHLGKWTSKTHICSQQFKKERE